MQINLQVQDIKNIKMDYELAEEQLFSKLLFAIGSNIPRASTQGFEITKPKK
jgi:hypothetical protein